MSDSTCPRCDAPIRDTAYVCHDCGKKLAYALKDVERVAGDITLTVARLDRVTRFGVSDEADPWHRDVNALFPTPLIVNLAAAAAHDAAAGELITWARHILEERGLSLTVVGHPLAATARFLAAQVDWLRHRPEAPEAFPAIHAACRTIENVVDRPADRTVVGRCPCGTYLYATKGAETVQCSACGTSYDVESSRDALREDLEDRLLTGGQIATMTAYLGLTKSREATRNLIKVWASRGRIVAHGRLDGDPAYRFGEVLTRLLQATSVVA